MRARGHRMQLKTRLSHTMRLVSRATLSAMPASLRRHQTCQLHLAAHYIMALPPCPCGNNRC